MNHWAASLVGRPWAPGGEGPHAFDCRGLVRHVWKTRVGRDVAPLKPEVMHSPRGVIEAALADGLRPVGRGLDAPAEDMDIVMMTGPYGPHVGVMVRDGERVKLLHVLGCVEEPGAVVFESRLAASLRGFGRFLLWRAQ
jgi:cell wall-associated NlpC family hydrolase